MPKDPPKKKSPGSKRQRLMDFLAEERRNMSVSQSSTATRDRIGNEVLSGAVSPQEQRLRYDIAQSKAPIPMQDVATYSGTKFDWTNGRSDNRSAYYLDGKINLGSRRDETVNAMPNRMALSFGPGAEAPSSFVLGHEYGHHLQHLPGYQPAPRFPMYTREVEMRSWDGSESAFSDERPILPIWLSLPPGQVDADITGAVLAARAGEVGSFPYSRLTYRGYDENRNRQDKSATLIDMLMQRAAMLDTLGFAGASDSVNAVWNRSPGKPSYDEYLRSVARVKGARQ